MDANEFTIVVHVEGGVKHITELCTIHSAGIYERRWVCFILLLLFQWITTHQHYKSFLMPRINLDSK